MSSSPNSKRKKYAHHAEFYLHQVDRCTRLAEDATEVARISSHLLMTLNRPPTIEDEMKASLIARTSVKIGRLDEQRRNSLPERKLLEDLLRVPFNVRTDVVGPKAPGRTFFVAERGDQLAPDEATTTDEVSNAV